MCKHTDGMLDLTPYRIRQLAKLVDRPNLYALVRADDSLSPFIVRRCDCDDRPPLNNARYALLSWDGVLDTIGERD